MNNSLRNRMETSGDKKGRSWKRDRWEIRPLRRVPCGTIPIAEPNPAKFGRLALTRQLNELDVLLPPVNALVAAYAADSRPIDIVGPDGLVPIFGKCFGIMSVVKGHAILVSMGRIYTLHLSTGAVHRFESDALPASAFFSAPPSDHGFRLVAYANDEANSKLVFVAEIDLEKETIRRICGSVFLCRAIWIATNGSCIYTVHNDGGVIFALDLQSGVMSRYTCIEIAPPPVQHRHELGAVGAVFCSTFSNELFALGLDLVGSEGKKIYAIDPTTGMVRTFAANVGSRLYAACDRQDEQTGAREILLSQEDGVRAIDVKTGAIRTQCLGLVQHERTVHTIASDHESDLIFCIDYDRKSLIAAHGWA